MITRFLALLLPITIVDSCGAKMRQNSRDAKILLKQGLGDAYKGEPVSSYLDSPDLKQIPSYYSGFYVEQAFAASTKLRADIYVKLMELDVAHKYRIPSGMDAYEVLLDEADSTGYTETYLYFITDIAERLVIIDVDFFFDLLIEDVTRGADFDEILAETSEMIENLSGIDGQVLLGILQERRSQIHLS